MANSAYGSGLNLDALMVPVQAATVYAAQESSLYLPGSMVPMVNVPSGSASAQVAVMGSVAATSVSSEATPGADFDTVLPSDTKISIDLNLQVARTVIRDLGGVDVNDMGRIMGNAIAAKVDTLVSAQFANLTNIEIGTHADLLHEFYEAIGAIRNSGETGPLAAVISAAKYGAFMKLIGGNAFAAADLQNAAMRTGALGLIAGVPVFVSSFLNDANTGLTGTTAAIFSQDALRGATQGGVKVETERRIAAVGTDVVASIAFGVGTLDASRGRILIDAV